MVTIQGSSWSLEGIECVLFDKDGTLIDSHTYWGKIIENRAKAIIRHYSLLDGIFPDLCHTMGYSQKEKRLLPEGPIALVSREEVIEAVHRFLIARRIPSSPGDLADIFLQEHKLFLDSMFDYIKLLPAVKDMLASLKKGRVKMAVVTTDSVTNTQKTLNQLDLSYYFDIVIGKETMPDTKVSGKPAMEAMRLLSVHPGRTICIGDAPMDLIMAKNSGLKAGIGVATGQIPTIRLQEYTPFVARSLGDLSVTTGDRQDKK